MGNSGLAGAGGLFRNSNGQWLKGLSVHLGVASNMAIELWVIRDGLSMAHPMNLQFLIIETDSTMVVDMLKDKMKILTLF